MTRRRTGSMSRLPICSPWPTRSGAHSVGRNGGHVLSISATTEWRTAHPGAVIGLLELSRVDNRHPSLQLDERKRETEARLRERHRGCTRSDFLSLPAMAAYARYYKRFGKTYHVLLQVESIVLKGRPLPNVSPLVDSNFMAEVRDPGPHRRARCREVGRGGFHGRVARRGPADADGWDD